MGKRILIYDEKNKFAELENKVEETVSGANLLIDLFKNFQPWETINTLQDFEELCTDPVQYFDNKLLKYSGIDLKLTGGKLPEPSKIAELLGIERNNYIAIIKGEKITEPCKPCQKVKTIKTGSGVLNNIFYSRYRDFTIWDSGKFRINETLLSEKRESFRIYASTPEQIAIYEYWNNLCILLNELPDKNIFGNNTLDQFTRQMKNSPLIFNFQLNKIIVDSQILLNEIQFMNSKQLVNE